MGFTERYVMRMRRTLATTGILLALVTGLFAPMTEGLPTALAAGTFVVNSSGDGGDTNPGDGNCRASNGTCTFRAAIMETNWRTGPDTINFNISGSGTGVRTIQLGSPLPTISDETGGTTINGYSQPGSAPNTDPLISSAAIRIEVVGRTSSPYFNGIQFGSSDNVLRGLALARFQRSVTVSGASADRNVIAGNFVGLYANGTEWRSHSGSNGGHGVTVRYYAKDTRIGGSAPADRNIIGGNGGEGIFLKHVGTTGTQIIGNIVGLSPDGRARRPNWQGIDFDGGPSDSLVEFNVFSGNRKHGIEVSHGPSTARTVIRNNFFGTDVTGNGSNYDVYANRYWSLTMEDKPTFTLVENNVLCNGALGGIFHDGDNSDPNYIRNNRIGVDAAGRACGNRGPGIQLHYHEKLTYIENNIIANNWGPGIQIDQGDVWYQRISQNAIYNNGGLGIDIDPIGTINHNGQYAKSGANGRQNFPIIKKATTAVVEGTACADCIVEVFIADSAAGQYGEGKTYLGSMTVGADMLFSVAVTGVSVGQVVTSVAIAPNGNTSEFSRNVAVVAAPSDPVVNLPGTIQAEEYGIGGPGVSYFDTTPGNSGNTYRSDDVDMQTCADPATPGGQTCRNIGWVVAGEWLAYKVNVTSAGWYTTSLRTASPGAGRAYRLEIDGVDVTGAVPVIETDDWQVWANSTSQPMQLPAGQHVLKIVAVTGDFNFNYLTVATAAAPTDDAPTVAIVAPGNAAALSGVVPVTIDAADDKPGLIVDVQIDGGAWQPAWRSETTGRWETLWDARGVTGPHTITARATDSSAQTRTNQLSVTLDGGTGGAVALAGRIEAEDYRGGGAGVGFLDTTAGNTGNKYRTDDVDIQSCTDPNSAAPCYSIGYIRTTEWLAYTVEATGSPVSLTIRVASAYDAKRLHLEIDGVDVTGPLIVPNTGSGQAWIDLNTGPITIGAGLHTLRIAADSGNFNVNYLAIVP